MKVLVCGASGFVGQAVCARLEAAGHVVLRGMRSGGDVAVDFAHDGDPAAWMARLAGVEVVVNAVGVIRDSAKARFSEVHHRAPAALFTAAAALGLRRIVQISALGAASGDTPYFASKRAADEHLAGLGVDWIILRPSLVFGAGGASTKMFCTLAALPAVPLPAVANARYQPVHIDDLADAVLGAVEGRAAPGSIVDVVALDAPSLPAMLSAYRRGLGKAGCTRSAKLRTVTVPAPIVALAARIGDWLPKAVLTSDTWRMLRAGSSAPSDGITRLLGRPPRAIGNFFASEDRACHTAELLRLRAQATLRGMVLRVALATVWLATAIVSAFIHPKESGLALLAATGITGAAAPLALYGASALDAAFGIATLVLPSRALWILQAALIAGYSAVIAVALPEFLHHPFGPLLKNLPILAILYILYTETWTTK